MKAVSVRSYADSKALSDKRFFFFIKRLMDILLSAIGLIILIPFFILLAIIIKLDDSEGRVFYSQIRIGKNQQPFRMYKFRSMYVDADQRLKDLLQYNDVDGAMFKMKHDPRITRVGHFIRKYSIDELPQLWNVLKGEMSLIGPRPPLEREVEDYSGRDFLRLTVTPGCTGLWQVSGRNSLTFDQMVDLDISYIRNACMRFDLKIMIRTVTTILKPHGAY